MNPNREPEPKLNTNRAPRTRKCEGAAQASVRGAVSTAAVRASRRHPAFTALPAVRLEALQPVTGLRQVLFGVAQNAANAVPLSKETDRDTGPGPHIAQLSVAVRTMRTLAWSVANSQESDINLPLAGTGPLA